MPHGKGVLRVGRKGWSMTDIDAIRRKHEAQVAYTKEKQGNFPYLFQSITLLSISDVDALFAALDEARGRVEKAIEQCDTEYGYVPVVGFKLIRRILKGGGDG